MSAATDLEARLPAKRLATVQARLALLGYQMRPCSLHGSWYVFGIARARHCAELQDVEVFAEELEQERAAQGAHA
ncbi:MAG: hypothetical protein K5880_09140 [Hydrogenophaga sp.]|uniref:hypothetical protein n=1 Tax=Hydrogenophaga sp. TaxID=1904254 RepID=UPI0026306E70|nr:hypothetical protein [Hydrogenophaga sp.]MCV0438786.1 hypothetical protein [Hydrogenophaga sp.]